MSGIASLTLAFLAAYSQVTIRHAKELLLFTAALCFVITSYRVWARERIQVEQLKSRLTPSLDVIFGASGPPFVQSHINIRDEEIIHYGIQIRNSGATTAKRIRVQMEGFRESGVMRTISYFDPKWNRLEVSLDPDETKGIQFLERANDSRVYLLPTSPRQPLDFGRHDLTIRVLAFDLPAREVRAVLDVEKSGKATLIAGGE